LNLKYDIIPDDVVFTAPNNNASAPAIYLTSTSLTRTASMPKVALHPVDNIPLNERIAQPQIARRVTNANSCADRIVNLVISNELM
jgi:hypothetical protein